jgi:hypothetical protein
METKPNRIARSYCLLLTCWLSISRVVTGSQLQRDIRCWLSVPDPWTNHNIARKTCYDGTTAWFTQTAAFNQWMSTASLLWIHGIRSCLPYLLLLLLLTLLGIVAGSGKSILWYALHGPFRLWWTQVHVVD